MLWKLGAEIWRCLRSGGFDVVTIVYSRFRSVVSQVPLAQRLIPAPVETSETAVNRRPAALFMIMSPTKAKSLPVLPRNISVQIFRALLENAASGTAPA